MDKEQKQARQDYPGAAADGSQLKGKVSESRVDAETKELNDNPRSDDGPRPLKY